MIYLDNCATTKPRDEVIEIMMKSLKDDFGNPSSLHRLGLNTEKQMKEARTIIARFLKVNTDELTFTSGGTESNNIAIQSIIEKYSKKGNHIITTNIEHPSVSNIYKYYESKGFDVTYLKVDNKGLIDLTDLKDAIKDDTILVSIIHVNNEIGTIQNIKSIRDIIRNSKANPYFHLDGIQSFGKIEFSLKELDVDTYSFSGHKVHGPKGIGGLYINKKNKLDPIVFGGNQERGLRSGTENLPGIIGLGEAVRLMSQDWKKENDKIRELQKYFINKLEENIDDIKFNLAEDEFSSPYIISVSLRDVRGEVLLHYLEQNEIYVSTGSACSSKDTHKSHVLTAIGLDNNDITGTIRICLSYEINKQDINFTVKSIKNAAEEIRSIIRRK